MVAASGARRELASRKYRGVDLPPEHLFGYAHGIHSLGKGHAADDEQIEIACRRLFTAGHRPIDESDVDAVLEWLQRSADDGSHTERLDDDVLEVLEDRRVGIGAKIDLVCPLFPQQQARVGEAFEFELHLADSGCGRFDNLAEVIGFIRVTEKQRKDIAPRLAEQGQPGVMPRCRHEPPTVEVVSY